MEESQHGFRSDRRTQDVIFTIRQIKEKLIRKSKTIYVYFIGLKRHLI